MEWWGYVVAIAVPLVTAIATVQAARVARRKVPEETANVLVNTAMELVEPLKVRIAELEGRVEELEKEVFLERRERLWREMHNRALVEELRAAGVAEPITIEEIRRMYPQPELRNKRPLN